ncbi:MAG: PAS domain-containing protein [Bacteroidia bacterium]|nr:PAS domain-containing protein [Bacteroidia bacterium]MCX7764665.1 PAS domain-containing protein [Bacteroidia bacterium]MDW8056784.1 PAS domain-containing protein [Bacteroidia bacterium]
MQQATTGDLVALFQQLAANLAKYEGTYEALKERIESLERELRDRKAILDKFAIVSETDTRGIITYANPKFCEVSGYSVEELVGKPHNIIRHPDMPKEAFKELWDTIKAGKIWQGEVKNRRKDGSHYWVLATVGPLLDEEGRPYRYVSMRIDITRLKDLEEKLREERNKLAMELEQNLKLAGAIQRALLPAIESGAAPLSLSLPYFVLFRPLHEVSGAFFWLHEEKGRILVLVGDTGTIGMAGSLISTLFIQEARYLIQDKGIISPERLVEELDMRLATLFKRQLSLPITADGIVALIDTVRRKLTYLSLRGRAFLAYQGQIEPLVSYPMSYGEMLGMTARENIRELEPGMRLYFHVGRLSGEGGLGTSTQITSILHNIQSYPFSEQRRLLAEALSGENQSDLLVIGIEIR